MICHLHRVALLGICLVLMSLTVPAAAANAPPTRPAEAVRILELRGDPAQLGTAHGQTLGPVIQQLHQRYIEAWFGSDWQRQLALVAAAAFAPKLEADHLAEVRALAAQTRIDPRQMMLAQCFLDLSPMAACSTVTLPPEAAPDGIGRFGRNLDFPSFDIADSQSVLMVYHPAGRYRFAAVSWPGLIGVLSGMNEHGLALANMEVARTGRPASAMPYTLLYRTLLERCKTVEEAIDLLEKTPRQTANNLMLMDAEGHRAVVEITPERIAVRRGKPGEALLSTNHQRGEEGQAPGRCWRYDRLLRDSAAGFGQIDRQNLQGMLQRVQQGDATLQSMIFEPATRTLYLATGKQAAGKPMERIDLTPYFADGGAASQP